MCAPAIERLAAVQERELEQERAPRNLTAVALD
jgi:hypothetical protein